MNMRSVLPLLLLLTVCLLPRPGIAQDIFAGAPPVPPGYATAEETRAALQSGKVARFSPPQLNPERVAVSKDVVYATPEGMALKLDVFVPKEAGEPRPLLLFIHGGGWSGGKKENYLHYNLHFAELGYVTASVQYRLAPEHRFPKAIQDVFCALAFLREHAATYKIDPKQVALVGGSAGGHLALLAGYAKDPALACPEAASEVAEPVQAVVNIYGVVDCTPVYAQKAPQVLRFLGKAYEEAPELYRQVSPLFHLTHDAPPTLTFHGTIDELVPVEQADILHAALEKLGVPNYYDRIEGWPHSMDVAQPINDRVRYVTEKFLAIHLPLPE